jgi:hypothetical protein
VQIVRGWYRCGRALVICECDRHSAFHNDAENGCRFWMPQDADHSGKRIIVCGGRDFLDASAVEKALRVAHGKRRIGVLVQGAEPGVDLTASRWAKRAGVLRDEFPADWNAHGRAAGAIRNKVMVDAGADGCVAFPGALDMIERAAQAGIPVWRPYG